MHGITMFSKFFSTPQKHPAFTGNIRGSRDHERIRAFKQRAKEQRYKIMMESIDLEERIDHADHKPRKLIIINELIKYLESDQRKAGEIKDKDVIQIIVNEFGKIPNRKRQVFEKIEDDLRDVDKEIEDCKRTIAESSRMLSLSLKKKESLLDRRMTIPTTISTPSGQIQLKTRNFKKIEYDLRRVNKEIEDYNRTIVQSSRMLKGLGGGGLAKVQGELRRARINSDHYTHSNRTQAEVLTNEDKRLITDTLKSITNDVSIQKTIENLKQLRRLTKIQQKRDLLKSRLFGFKMRSRKSKSSKRKSSKRKSSKRKSSKRKSSKRKASRKRSRKRKASRKISRKRRSVKRKTSRKRKSSKSSKRKASRKTSRKRKSSKRCPVGCAKKKTSKRKSRKVKKLQFKI